MNRVGTSLLALLLVNATLSAQAPQPPEKAVAPLPADPVLFQHLQGWEQVMKNAQNFFTNCTLNRENKIRNTRTDFKGSIMCLKPDMARLRIEVIPALGAEPNPKDYVAYICTPKTVYEYDGKAAQVTEYRFQFANTPRQLLLEFLSGSLTAKSVQERFTMRIVKQDENYIYLELKPRSTQDKSYYESITVVLFLNSGKPTDYLPRTVVIHKSNGLETETWNFLNPSINLDGVKPEHFAAAPVPKGWKHVVQTVPQWLIINMW